MIRLFLGTDSLAKEQHLKAVASQKNAEIRRFNDGDSVPSLTEFSENTLFGPVQVFVFDNSIAKTGLLEKEDQLLAVSADIIILEDVIPKRGNALLAFSKNSNVEVVNFDPPALTQVPAWLEERAKFYNTTITSGGIQSLLAALVPEPASSWEKPTVDLRLLDHELQKLATYTDGKPINEETVGKLTKKNSSAEVWHVINAIADKNSKLVFSSLEKFMSDAHSTGDDKAKLIMLNALLADQFRNILMVQDFLNSRIPDQEILAKTGWKSGRLFQLKKISSRFNSSKLRQILQRLEDLDIELKTSSIPARPIMDLILSQVL